MARNYGEKIYEGKAKILYRTQEGHLIHYFKDEATAFNAQKKAVFEGKGILNNEISCLIFEYLNRHGLKTHFLKRNDERSFFSWSLQMLPVEVVVRNRVAGSLAKRLQWAEGAMLKRPLVEWYLKDDSKGDPLISEDLLILLFDQKKEDLKWMKDLALQVNQLLISFFQKGGLTLVDLKLEFGKNGDAIIIADEISPDTCRLWDAKTGEKFDKDLFRFDLGNLMEGYQVVYERLKNEKL